MEAAMSPDVMSEQLAKEIQEAGEALLARAKERDDWWHAYELKDRARNGWSAGAMNIALRRLVDTNVFEQQGDRIRLHH
jgi:hypothetical protein